MNRMKFIAMLALGTVMGAGHLPAQALRVVATNSDIASMARRIGGSDAQVALIVPPSMNPHNMPLRPSMLQKFREADLMMTIGLDHEPWLLDALTASGNGGIQPGGAGYVDCSVGIQLMNVPTGQVSRSQGDIHVYGNTHYWGDPRRAKLMAVHILHGLTRKLPSKKEELRGRCRALLAQIDAKIGQWKRSVAKYANTPVVLYHQSWNYLMDFLNLEVAGYVEMRPGIEPTPAHIARLQETMKARGVKVIFMEPFFNRGQAQSVAGPVGAKVVVLPGSTGETQDYVDWMDGVVDRVAGALKGS